MFSKDTRRGDKFKKVDRHFNGISKVKEVDEDICNENEETKKNSRKMNKQIATQTCEILDTCKYVYNDNVVNITLEDSETFKPKDLEKIRSYFKNADTGIDENKNKTKFIIVKTKTLDAIHNFYGTTKLGVLNFASARNPGGGFLKGSDAQEESLARASGLYATIRHSPMYEANEKDNNRCIYQEYLIYSPNVPIFRDTNDDLIKEPIYVDIISVPAVNEGEAIKKGVSKLVIDNTRYDRMESFLGMRNL
ncbi:MAG: TIGR02452 family protein [Candidatus Paceibacterota bacterium]